MNMSNHCMTKLAWCEAHEACRNFRERAAHDMCETRLRSNFQSYRNKILEKWPLYSEKLWNIKAVVGSSTRKTKNLSTPQLVTKITRPQRSVHFLWSLHRRGRTELSPSDMQILKPHSLILFTPRIALDDNRSSLMVLLSTPACQFHNNRCLIAVIIKYAFCQ